jgi:hypothetical protein
MVNSNIYDTSSMREFFLLALTEILYVSEVTCVALNV